MKNLLLALLLFSASAFGQVVTLSGPVTLTWVGPDVNTDGTPYEDRGGFNVYWGDSHSGVCDTFPNKIALTDPDQVQYTAQYPLDSFPATLCFTVTAVSLAGNESVPSNLATRTISIEVETTPEAPVIQSLTMNLVCVVDTGVTCTVTVE
jgi:hypothetical protein